MDKETIIIIGGGPSVKDCHPETLHEFAFTIGVNEASVLVSCHTAVSMDRLWMEARYELLEAKKIPTFFRRCAWKKGYEWDLLELFNGDVHAESMSDKPGSLFGKNSGVCAVNLAYQKKPKRLFLFGFDMKTDQHKNHYFYDPGDLIERKRKITDKHVPVKQSGSKYKYWLPMYTNVARQCKDAGIEVFNVSPDSAIDVFKKINYKEFLNEIG